MDSGIRPVRWLRPSLHPGTLLNFLFLFLIHRRERMTSMRGHKDELSKIDEPVRYTIAVGKTGFLPSPKQLDKGRRCGDAVGQQMSRFTTFLPVTGC